MTKQNKGRKFFAASATAALVASAIVPVASAAQVNDFNKVAPYAKEAVQALVDNGVIQGDEKGNFNPTSTVTRAEAAQIFVNALELEAEGSVNFSDVKASAWYYDAIAAAVENGIFEGVSATQFAPSKSLTRAEAAKILVEAFDLTGEADLSQFDDASSVKAWAKPYLEIAVANGIFNGSTANGKTNLNPNASITRQEFAVVFHRTVGAEAETPEVDATVKAINNTTVEVTFENAVTDLADKNFAIEGLTISNKSVKQTDSKTVVLTTSAQTADVEYTVTVNGEAVGKFKGVAEVIPTKITTTTTSLQGVIGEQVTVKTQVEVAANQSKAGIPVTFNILNNNNANDKIEVQAHTNAEGVASYTYTRYYGSEDTVTAYATKKSSLYDQAKVYWANKIQLAVSEVNEGTELANDTKKTFKVNGAPSTTYYIAIKENLGVASDKVVDVKVQDSTGGFVKPYETTSGSNNFAKVTTNSNGEAAFSIYGTNLSATPIVYAPQSTPTTPVTFTYNKLDLQAEAKTITFKQIDALNVTVAAVGTEKAARYAVAPTSGNSHSAGGRTYTATVTNKDGSVVPAGTLAYVTFQAGDVSGDVYLTSGAATNFTPVKADTVYRLVVGKEGKVQFRVMGAPTTAEKLAFAKPTVFLNTAGDLDTNETSTSLITTGHKVALNKGDVQVVGETTYFQDAVVANAELEVTDSLGRTVTTSSTTDDVYFRYQSVDQNGFAYRPTSTTTGGDYVIYVPVYADGIIIGYRTETRNDSQQIVRPFKLAFDVTSSTGQVDVYQGNSGVPLVGSGQNTSRTKTYEIESDVNGVAVIRVKAALSTKVSVNVTGSNSILPTKAASVQFVKAGTLPNVYQNAVTTFNTIDGTITFLGEAPITMKSTGTIYKKNGVVLTTGYTGFASELAVVAAHNVAAPGSAQGVIVKRTVDNDGIVTYDIIEVSTSVATKITNSTPSNSALQTAIDNLNAAVAPVKVADYISGDQPAVQAALDAAKAVLNGGSTTAQDYVTALNVFNAAIAGKTTVLVAAKADLLVDINAVNPTDYISTDQAAVTAAKVAAQAAHALPAATVATIATAKADLAAALVGKTKKAKLTQAEVTALNITATEALVVSDSVLTIALPVGTTATLDAASLVVTGTAQSATKSVSGLDIKLESTTLVQAQGSTITVNATVTSTDKLDTDVKLTLTYAASAWTVAKVLLP